MSAPAGTVSEPGPSSGSAQPQEAGNTSSADAPMNGPSGPTAPAYEAYEQLVQELAEAQEREMMLRQPYEAQLAEARAAVHHFAAQRPPATPEQVQPVAQAAPLQTVAPAVNWQFNQARTPVIPQLLAPPLPAVPVGNLLTAGQGRATVYGPTVAARHDVAVYHALGYDAGDLITATTQAAARQREQERHMLVRPMVPMMPSGPPQTASPQNDVYQEDNFSVATSRLQPAPAPPGVHLSADGTTYTTPYDRAASGQPPTVPLLTGPTTGHTAPKGTSGAKYDSVKMKMLPPHLH